jgi:hypothetical protein
MERAAANKNVPRKVPLGTPSTNVIPFRKKANRRLSDEWVREYLRSIYGDPMQPFERRVKAAMLSPWFGERWGT